MCNVIARIKKRTPEAIREDTDRYSSGFMGNRTDKTNRANKSDRTNNIFLKKRLMVWILLVFLHRSNDV